METIEAIIRRRGFFLRRRDLRALGLSDHSIRHALEIRSIFRVRQGWYSVSDAPPAAIRAVRVGGRLTSVSALASYGLLVPIQNQLHVAVPSTASRLRSSTERRVRLVSADGVRVHWVDRRTAGSSSWRVSVEDALLAVLTEEPRDIAIACASAVMRHQRWSSRQMDAVFARAPLQCRAWRSLVGTLDDSHGETFLRLWFLDAGIPFVQQVQIEGIGRFDFRVGPHTFVEVDGGQHDPGWTDPATNSWEKGHDWDASMAIIGNVVLRYSYRQLYTDLDRVLQSIERVVDNDRALTALRRKHPYIPRSQEPIVRSTISCSTSLSHARRKRRTFATKPLRTATDIHSDGESPAFSEGGGGLF